MYILILVYVIFTIIRPQDYVASMMHLPVMPTLMIAALVFWLFRRDKDLTPPQYRLLVAFLLAVMVSMAATGWIGGAILRLEQFGPVIIFFIVLAAAVKSTRGMTVMLAALVICAAVLALHGVYQFHNGVGWTGMPLSQDRRIQYVGIFNDPNDLGLLFVTVIPMAVYLFGRGGWFGLLRLLWLVCIGLLLYGIWLTNSRGSLLALGAIVCVWLWQKRGVITAAVLGGAGLAVMMMLPSRLQDVSVDESSAFGRVDAWYEGLHMFTSHPLLGIGAGNFTEYNDLTAHNSFILVLAETGFVGYVLWLAFVGYGFWMMLTIVRHKPEFAQGDMVSAAAWRRERTLAASLLLAQCGFIAAAFFLSRSYVVVLYMLAALVVGEYAGARIRYPTLPQFNLRDSLVMWPVLAAASVIVLFIVVRVLMMIA